MSESSPYCPAAQRVFDAWAAGCRARNWSKEDLDEALLSHRNQWQEVAIRQSLGYHAFDSGQLDAARAHLGYACHIAKGLWGPDEPFALVLSLELAFMSFRSGKPHPHTEELLLFAQHNAGLDDGIPFAMTKVKAAQMLFEGDSNALTHIEAAARWARQQPNSERDNWQAELDWLQAMRNEYFERGLG